MQRLNQAYAQGELGLAVDPAKAAEWGGRLKASGAEKHMYEMPAPTRPPQWSIRRVYLFDQVAAACTAQA